jgi:hypothetical protein
MTSHNDQTQPIRCKSKSKSSSRSRKKKPTADDEVAEDGEQEAKKKKKKKKKKKRESVQFEDDNAGADVADNTDAEEETIAFPDGEADASGKDKPSRRKSSMGKKVRSAFGLA